MHATSLDAFHLNADSNQFSLNASKQIVISIRRQEVAVFVESIATTEDIFHHNGCAGNPQLAIAKVTHCCDG